MKFKDVEPGKKFIAPEITDHMLVKVHVFSRNNRGMEEGVNAISTHDGHFKFVKEDEEVVIIYA